MLDHVQIPMLIPLMTLSFKFAFQIPSTSQFLLTFSTYPKHSTFQSRRMISKSLIIEFTRWTGRFNEISKTFKAAGCYPPALNSSPDSKSTSGFCWLCQYPKCFSSVLLKSNLVYSKVFLSPCLLFSSCLFNYVQIDAGNRRRDLLFLW